MKFLNNKKSLIISFFIILLLSVIACRQLFLPGYFSMHDDLQISRLYQMDKCIKDRQIPCRWVPDMGYGYGYPLFNFYPPFPYYLGEAFHLLGFSLINAVKLLFILGLTSSGIFMFLLAKEFWGKLGGLISAAFYIFAPYLAVDIYVRGAMNEFWAIAFFPAIFWTIAELVKSRQKRYMGLLGLFYGLLLLSHNIMTMVFTPLVVVWSFFLLWHYKKSLKALVPIIVGGAWGVGLAAFFTLPVVFEKRFVHVETMLMGYFNYLAHFVSLKQLFFSRFWGFGASTWGEEDGMPFQIGYLHWLVPMISFGLLVILWWKKKINFRYIIMTTGFVLLFLLSAFLTHLRATPIWQIVKPLEYLQFPWRFLAIVIFALSFLAGSFVFSFEKLLGKKIRKSIFRWVIVALIAAVAISNFGYFKPEKVIKIIDEDKLFSPKGWYKLQTDAIFDYLPVYAEKPPGQPAPEGPEVLEGKAGITYLEKGTDWYRFQARVIEGPAMIRLPIFDFPNWKVWIDEKTVVTNNDNFLGLITFEVPVGDHNVSARLTNTPIRTIANLISLVSWVALVFFFLFFRSRIHFRSKIGKDTILDR